MKLDEAQALILKHERAQYRVSFERRGDGVLRSDHFPERDEPGFSTIPTAVDWMKRFANATPADEIVNIRIVDGQWSHVGHVPIIRLYPPPDSAKK